MSPLRLNRVVVSALVAALCVQPSCMYRDGEVSLKTVKLTLDGVQTTRVGGRIDVELRGDTAHTTVTRMCVEMRTGRHIVRM